MMYQFILNHLKGFLLGFFLFIHIFTLYIYDFIYTYSYLYYYIIIILLYYILILYLYLYYIIIYAFSKAAFLWYFEENNYCESSIPVKQFKWNRRNRSLCKNCWKFWKNKGFIFKTCFHASWLQHYISHYNHSHNKRKDSLEGSLDRVLFAAKLEFPKKLVPRLPQHTSDVNIKCAGKSVWSKQLYYLYVANFLELWYILILLFWY